MRSCLAVALALAVSTAGGARQSTLFPHSLLDAHNCYPDEGRWTDRIDRALATGSRPIAIEQDVAWHLDSGGSGQSLVVHDTPATGREPTLETYFFDKVRPIMDAALASPEPATWPLLILHLDFKTNEAAHHRAIWELLGRHERWLTTAPRMASDEVQPFTVGPLLVLTENGAGQSAAFYDTVPIGGRLRIFGTVPSAMLTNPAEDRQAQFDAAINASPESLIPAATTNYRRWVNFPWAVVERGGQAAAGPWTSDDDRRLRSIVGRAHALGLWVRFYTLNGHTAAESENWTGSYNFGSLAAVEARWRAAIDAGADFIATDQYPGLARLLAGRRR